MPRKQRRPPAWTNPSVEFGSSDRRPFHRLTTSRRDRCLPIACATIGVQLQPTTPFGKPFPTSGRLHTIAEPCRDRTRRPIRKGRVHRLAREGSRRLVAGKVTHRDEKTSCGHRDLGGTGQGDVDAPKAVVRGEIRAAKVFDTNELLGEIPTELRQRTNVRGRGASHRREQNQATRDVTTSFCCSSR